MHTSPQLVWLMLLILLAALLMLQLLPLQVTSRASLFESVGVDVTGMQTAASLCKLRGNSSGSSQTLKRSCTSACQATVVRPLFSVSLASFPSKHGASSQSQRLSRQPRQSLSMARRLQQNESSGRLRSDNLEKEGYISGWLSRHRCAS